MTFRRVLASLFGVAALCPAASTTVWEMSTFQDFQKGRLQGLSLYRDGRLELAPRLDLLFSSEQPAVWSVARATDGTLYLGTGHRGRVYRVAPDGKGALLWTADQPEVFALALDAQNRLYAATSPDGRVYRIENGKAVEYFNPQSHYIWALAVDRNGVLYVGTGDQGKVYRVTAPQTGEVYYDTGQAHVTALALDTQNRLLAGTEPNGLLYRVTAKDQAFVLQDSSLPEIRSIVPMPDGSVYTSALGGSLAQRVNAASSAASAATSTTGTASVTTTITVTDQNAQIGPDIKPKADATRSQTATAATTQTAAPAAAATVDLSGVEKSAIYRIYPDQTVETLWSSKEENAYDVLPLGDRVYFTTDVQGRVYQLQEQRKLALVVQTDEGEGLRLLPAGKDLLAATGTLGRLYRLRSELAPGAVYESPVHDANTVARWGRISWRGAAAPGRLVLRTRSGNSARPDRTWSDWSAPLTEARGSAVTSPNARYMQWRAEFQPGSGPAPALNGVSVAYLPQNTAPVMKSVNVTAFYSPTSAGKVAATPATASAQAAYSVTVTDTGEVSSSTPAGTSTQLLNRVGATQLLITWQAEDAESDKLMYRVSVKGEGEREWKVLKADLTDASLTIDADTLADGRYLFQVVASDKASNAPAEAREAELVSPPVLLDNTPPRLTASVPARQATTVTFTVDAADDASPLRRAEYSVDAGPWLPLGAQDGVIDSQQERFVVKLDNLAPTEHAVVIRVYDSGGNAGLLKLLVR